MSYNWTKYNNKKITVNGQVFDSKKEANRYKELLLLIVVLTIDALVMARLASVMPIKYCVMVVLAGTYSGLLIGVFSDREV